MTRTTKILNLVYCFTVLLFLLDGLTSFDIKSQFLKSIVYIGFLIETPVILFWNVRSLKTKAKKVIGTVYPMIFLILIFIVTPMKILFSSNAWHTQEILYQHGHLNFRTVEFQMQSVGALGYNSRTVEVFYLTPLFMSISEVPSDIGKRAEWIKVDKEVNELNLKSP